MDRAIRPSLPMLRPPISMPPVCVPTSRYDYPSMPMAQNYIDYSQRLYGGVYQDDDFSWMDYAAGYEPSQAAPVRQIRPLQYYGQQQPAQLSQWPVNTFQEPRFTQRLPPPTYRPVRPLPPNYATNSTQQQVKQRPTVPAQTKNPPKPAPRGPRPPSSAVKTLRQGSKEDAQHAAKLRKMNPPMPMLPPPKSSSKVVAAKRPEPKPQSPPRPSHPLLNVRILTGSIPKILRWNGDWMMIQQKKQKASDPPPLYMTVGRLIGFWGGKDCHQSETRFLLEELPHSASGNNPKLHCTYFAIDQPFGSHYIGSSLRCVGVFFNSRDDKKKLVFQCVALRAASDADVRFVVARQDKVQSMINQKQI